jgi:NhaP-type Na+/H+ or K+/H+ antiporter
MESWSLAVVAGLVLVYAAVSRRLDRSPLTPAIFFVCAGLVTGGEALAWIDLQIGSESVRLLAEVTLTLVLFADASRLDLGKLRREYAVPVRLLGIGLPLTIALGTALAAWVIADLDAVEALVLAVVLAPTDAALGQAVVTDRRLPSRIRQGLNVESGLNDGICVPLLFIALAVAEAEEGAVSTHEAVVLVVEEIGYGILGGAAAGAAAAALLLAARRRRMIESSWLQILPAAAAALAYGLAAPLDGSGFIAAFVGGFVFGGIVRRTADEVTHLVDEVGELLNGVTFLVFGAAILGPALGEMGWEVAVYALLSLTVARMAPVALSLLGTRARAPTVAYVGWFGPRGLASIVFAVIVVEEAALPHAQLIVLAIVTTVALSVLAHGLSARPLTDRYARWYESHPRERRPAMEAVPVGEHRWRWRREPRGNQA